MTTARAARAEKDSSRRARRSRRRRRRRVRPRASPTAAPCCAPYPGQATKAAIASKNGRSTEHRRRAASPARRRNCVRLGEERREAGERACERGKDVEPCDAAGPMPLGVGRDAAVVQPHQRSGKNEKRRDGGRRHRFDARASDPRPGRQAESTPEPRRALRDTRARAARRPRQSPCCEAFGLSSSARRRRARRSGKRPSRNRA